MNGINERKEQDMITTEATQKETKFVKAEGIARDPFLQKVVDRLEAYASEKGLRLGSLFAEDLSTPDAIRPVESKNTPYWKMLESHDYDLLVVAGSGNDGSRWDDGFLDMATQRACAIDETRLVSFVSLTSLDALSYSDAEYMAEPNSKGRSLWLLICNGAGDNQIEYFPLIANIGRNQATEAVCPELAGAGSPNPETEEGKRAVEFLAELVWNQCTYAGVSTRIDAIAFGLDKSRKRYMNLDPYFLDWESVQGYALSDEEYKERLQKGVDYWEKARELLKRKQG